MSASSDEDGGKVGGDYEVGYGKPPKHTRFQPGNPGRRRTLLKKAATKHPGVTGEEIVQQLLRRKTRVKRGDRVVELDFVETIVSRLHGMVTQGDARDIMKILEFVAKNLPRALTDDSRLDIVLHHAPTSGVAPPPAELWDDPS